MAEVQAWPRYWQARRASSRVSAAIVDASTSGLFGFANAILDAVFVQRPPFGGHGVLPARGNTCSVWRNRACDSSSNARSASIPPAQSGLRHCPAGARRRPALCTGSGGGLDASDASLWRTFSSAVLPTSSASANSCRSCLIFTSAVRSCSGRLAVCCSVARSAVLLFFDSCTVHVRGLGVTARQ
jgi:hypothetical protein